VSDKLHKISYSLNIAILLKLFLLLMWKSKFKSCNYPISALHS